MTSEKFTGQSELAAALREMLDGFGQSGVLLATAVDAAIDPKPTPTSGPTPE